MSKRRSRRWQRFADAINRAFRLAESLKNAATPESLLCRCEDVRCGDVAAADDWLQAKLDPAPAGCMAGRCRSRESRCPPPARKRLLPSPG
ncbi:Putative oxidoreductase in 4-hydroxyproline catabolic gene cluster [Klebsiella pneumoniae subsp. pneumoniae ST258-K26BO]|nr:Putative oxidoreductase in 4-hydroxyproline catabolic gene cluster [Klebsiella pneumoniae subsp. pneumoniae ST258-K26BO]